MGTNYYIKLNNKIKHIGKLSFGFHFLFNAKSFYSFENLISLYTEEVYKNKKSYEIIFDEYDNYMGMDEFLDIIFENKKETNILPPEEYDFRDDFGYYFLNNNFC